MTTSTTPPKGKTPLPATFDALLGVFVDKDGIPIPPKRRDRPKPVSPHGFQLDTRSVYDKDLNVLLPENRVVERDADGYHARNAGRKTLGIKPRLLYKRGVHFKVVGENVRIEAMCNYGAGPNGHQLWSGWSQRLPVGTVVECLGWRRFRKDGLVAPQFTFSGLPAEARWSTIWPNDGVWRPWPLAGLLEKIDPKDLEPTQEVRDAEQ